MKINEHEASNTIHVIKPTVFLVGLQKLNVSFTWFNLLQVSDFIHQAKPGENREEPRRDREGPTKEREGNSKSGPSLS